MLEGVELDDQVTIPATLNGTDGNKLTDESAENRESNNGGDENDAKTAEEFDAKIAEVQNNAELSPEAKEETIKALQDGKAKLTEKDAGKEEKKQDEANPLPEELRSVFPDAKSPEDVVSSYQNIQTKLQESEEANQQFLSLLEKNPSLVNLLKEVANDNPVLTHPALSIIIDGVIAKKPTIEIIRELNDSLGIEEIPEQGTPEYEAFVRSQIQKENTLKAQEADRKEKDSLKVKGRDAFQRQSKDFQEKRKLTDDEMKKFLKSADVFLKGDAATGVPASDFLEKLYFAMNREKEIKEAEERGKISGRNEVIEEYKKNGNQFKTRGGDGLPHVTSAAGKANQNKDGLDWMRDIVRVDDQVFIP